MNPAPSAVTLDPALPDRLNLAVRVLRDYRARCFWFLAPEFEVTEATLPLVIAGLRRHGDRPAFQIAAQLCR